MYIYLSIYLSISLFPVWLSRYLFPLWCCGVLVRYLVLFPTRLFILAMGWLIFLVLFLISQLFLRPVSIDVALSFERSILQLLACSFVASWTGVIKYHGTPPERRANQVRRVHMRAKWLEIDLELPLRWP